MKDLIFVFDVDSTVITFESLNKIISQNINDKKKSKELDEIASKALNGEYDYHKAFILRFYLTNLTKENFIDENKYIKNNLVEKIKDVFNLLFKEKCEVYLLSGGFKINIDCVAKLLKISDKNVFANDFIEKDGKLVLNDSPLTYVDGKIDACKEIKKRYKNPFLTMIGDGVTDMNVWKQKIANEFIGAGYVAKREKIQKEAKYFANTVDELIGFIKNIIKENR